MKKVVLFICILGFSACENKSGSDSVYYLKNERDSVIGTYRTPTLKL